MNEQVVTKQDNSKVDTKLFYLIGVFSVLAAIGLADSIYLLWSHFQPDVLNCSLLEGCDLVLQSEYSTILGIPTATFGVAYYSLLVLISGLSYFKKDSSRFVWAALLTPVGFGASLLFVYLQAFIIEAYCQYCLVSALIATILLFLAVWIIRQKGNRLLV